MRKERKVFMGFASLLSSPIVAPFSFPSGYLHSRLNRLTSVRTRSHSISCVPVRLKSNAVIDNLIDSTSRRAQQSFIPTFVSLRLAWISDKSFASSPKQRPTIAVGLCAQL
jgi:hypothetical protein